MTLSIGLDIEPQAQDWKSQGVCAGTYSNLWFPYGDGDDSGLRHHVKETARAKELCFTCPVRIECLTYALDTNQRWGIWGGFGPEERTTASRAIRKSRASGKPFNLATYRVKTPGRSKVSV